MASVRDVGVALGRMMLAFDCPKEKLPAHRIETYERGLLQVPGPLLELAAERVIDTLTSKYRGWMPSVAQIKDAAEALRVELLAAHIWEPCETCRDNHGWVEVTEANVTRVTRCICWRVHRHKLAEIGVTNTPLSLPPAREVEPETA